MNKYVLCFLSFCFFNAAFSQGALIENKGQLVDFNENLHPEVAYYYSQQDASVFFQSDRLVYNFVNRDEIPLEKYHNDKEGLEEAMRQQKATYYRMDMVFLNAASNPIILPQHQNEGKTHFYLNKRNGIRDVRSFKKITYQNVYPNIDVVFYQNEKGLKYDLVLKTGANLQDIRIQFQGAQIEVRENVLHLILPHKEFVEEIPLSFIDDDKNKEVEVMYQIFDNQTIGFKLRKEVPYSTLTIDPVLEWATYFNLASGSDNLYNIANHLDNDGNYFSYGMAQNAANSYPVVNPGTAYTTLANGSADAYLVKFNANRQMVWGTYLGGSGYDEIYDGEIIKTFGSTLHLVGERITSGAPYTNGGGFYQNIDARNFWARFDKNTGTLQHLTSLSSGYKPSIAISSTGLVAISNDVYDFNVLPILNRAGAYNQAVNGGFKDMGLLLFNAAYTQIWGTFLGGTGSQENFLCAFDSNNNIYFVGETSNNASLVNLPGAYNQSTVGGNTDVMLGKFNMNGQLVWNTLYGGNGADARRGQQGHGARILVHPTTNELVLAFNTTSNNLPLTNLAGAYNKGVPTHIDFGGSSGSYWNYAAYLCKFSTTGALNYATYFYTGTGGGDIIENIAFGGCNKFFIGGSGEGAKTLTGASAGYNLLNATGAGRSGMITMLNANTFAFEWDSYLNTNISSEANVAANVNLPVFYSTATLYYNNLPVVNPGSPAYYNVNSNNPGGAGVGINQYHVSLPPIVSPATICSGGSVTLTASGGMGAPYTWYAAASGGSALFTGASYNVSPSTTTTYYVSSGSGICASPRIPVTVTVNSALTTPTINYTGGNCEGATMNFSTAAVAGATYFWTGPNSFSSNSQNPTITNATTANTGTYSLYIVVAGCTSATATTHQAINAIPATPTVGSNSPLCGGQNLNLTSNTYLNGVYYWTGPNGFTSNLEDPTLSNVSSVNAGTYSLFVEVNGCSSAVASTNVVVNNKPTTPTILSNAPLCAGTSLNLSTTTIAGASYYWTGPNGFSSTSQNPSISPATTSASGSYSLVVIQNGCTSDVATANIVVNAAPTTPVISSNSPLCTGSNLQLQGPTVSGATYVWTGPNGFTSSNEDPTLTNVTLANAGTYSLTIVVGSCSSTTATHAVSINTAPTITIGTVTNPAQCGASNGSIQVQGAGNAFVYWIGTSTGNTNNVALPYTIPNLPAGAYDVFIVPSAGCTSNVLNVNLVNPNPPATPSINSNSPLCVGQSLNLDANTVSGAAYFWTGPNGFTSSLEDPTISNISNAAAGTYSLFLVANACTSATASVLVQVNAVPTQPNISVNSPLCEGGTIQLGTNAVSNATYVWSGPNGFSSTIQNPSISNATLTDAGTYSLTIVTNGCSSASATQQISIGNVPTLQINASATSVCAGNLVTLTGSGAANLSWDNGVINGQAFQIFATQTYTLTGYDVAGCSATQSITIQVIGSGGISVNITPSDPDSSICAGSNLALSASGAGNYLWLHNNSTSTTVNVNPTQTTTYTVVGFVGACSDTTQIQIDVLSGPNYQLIASDSIHCPGSPVVLTASGTGATVVWNTGETTQSISVAPSFTTNYSFIATSADGCTTLDSINVSPGILPILNLADSLKLCESGSLLNAGNNFSAYLWNTGDTSASISITQSNLYSVTVWNAMGCSASDSTFVSFSTFPSDYGILGDHMISICAYATFTFEAFGGTHYQWTGPNNFASTHAQNEIFSVTPSNEGAYIVQIFNSDNCFKTDTIHLGLSPDKDCVEITELITPNGDGKNDALFFSYLSQYPNHKLSIYNRWGSLVYETSNYQNDWSGVANTGALAGKGEKLPSATYFYIFDPGNGDKPKRGFVELQY